MPVYGGGGVRPLRLELRERYAGSCGETGSKERCGACASSVVRQKIGGTQVLVLVLALVLISD